jgi:hypothetical protein
MMHHGKNLSRNLETALLQQLFKTHQEPRRVYSDPGLLFKDLLVKEKITGLLGTLTYEIFYSEPMLVINPALYTPPQSI